MNTFLALNKIQQYNNKDIHEGTRVVPELRHSVQLEELYFSHHIYFGLLYCK